MGRPLANERYAVYLNVLGGTGPILLEESASLDTALGWVQDHHREVRRTFGKRGAKAYGEVFDWDQGASVLFWLVAA
jgi:hypothetical protein